MPTIAIIGAGCSGLAAAHTLRDAGWSVVLFEQSADVGGRATTQTGAGFIYDPGAQYIKRGNPSSVALITERFRAPDLIDIQKPIWIFDGQGHIQEGDPVQNAEPKWNYRSGLITLAQRMAAGLDIRCGKAITQVQQTSTGWQLFASAQQPLGTFEHLLLTMPASRASTLIAASQLSPDLQHTICTQLDQASYHPLLSVALGYRPEPDSRPYYALVNTDRAHPISWLAWEHEKAPERTPQDTRLLIAQMAPQYSREHWDTPDADLARDVATQVVALIVEALPTPIFSAIQRWRYALPATRANADQLNAVAQPHRLAFCGDAFVGGRVHLAIEHGILVANQLIAGA